MRLPDGGQSLLGPYLAEFAWNPLVLLAVAGLAVAAAYVADSGVPQPALVVEIRADTAGMAQVFYDTGAGMSEAESAIVPVAASEAYARVYFPLPDREIRALRFDPLTGAGSFSVRRVFVVDGFGGVMKEFAPEDLTALNQIATRVARGSEVHFSTALGANDPMLQIAVSRPFDPSPWTLARAARALVAAVLALLVAGLAGAVFVLVQPYGPPTGRALDRLAAAISDPRFLVFDRLAVGWYLAVAAAFVALVSAGLHGSGLSLHANMAPADDSTRPIIGTAKPIRSDEWAYHTPAILHQVYRADPFAAERSALGPDNAALISNVPVRHVTTLFRPQFWGFFALPVSYGFSFYWQFKALLLLAGVFTLLLLLTDSSRLAALGTLWYATSAYVQWTYSWASLLPEMVGLFCLVMAATFYMSVGRRPDLLLAAAAICAGGAINFALCAYIPHQIPLVWFGVFLCGWWVWVRWGAIATRDGLGRRVAAMCGAWFVVAIVMLVFYRDAEAALTTIANTSYPGQRVLPGGAYAMSMLFSHFFGFWADDVHFPLPQAFGNISECAGFFWLAPITLFSVRAMGDEPHVKRAYWTLLVFGVLLFAWLTLPIPQGIGRATFLDKSGSGRSLHVLGLVNVALVMMCLRLSRAPGGFRLQQSAMLGGAVFAIVFPFFLLLNGSLANFLTIPQVTLAAGYVVVLTIAIVENRFWLLGLSLVVPQLIVFGLVNPVDRGLHIVESSPLFQFVHSRAELLRDRWIVYSPSPTHPGFFNAVGCEVVTGLDYVPDLESLSFFDPAGAQREMINRSVWLIAVPKYDDGPAVFQHPQFNMLIWHVSPLDPGLGRIGVRFAAFRHRPPAQVAVRLKELTDVPVSGFWLYELPDPDRDVRR
jgi:hypothetical protein